MAEAYASFVTAMIIPASTTRKMKIWSQIQ
jgi:hypothetical protein